MNKEFEKVTKDMKKKGESFFGDFKKFISKGNVLDLAVAVIIANAFNAIVTGLVKYIITPLITFATSGVSINEWEWVIREAVVDEAGAETISKVSVQYGLWLQSIVDFLIIAFSIFVAVRILRNAERKLMAKQIAIEEAEKAKKKAEADAAAALEKQKEEARKAVEEEFYANVREQSMLLRDIRDAMKH